MRHVLGLYTMLAVVAVACTASVPSAQAAVVAFTTPATAVQQVNLLGVAATLTAAGNIHWNLDLDSNGNSITGGGSALDALFLGTLPSEFAPLGVAGAPFTLFALGPELITVTGNGAHLSVDTRFGLNVLGPGGIVLAEFFTAAPSNFSADIPHLPFRDASVVFQGPNRPNDFTEVFIGTNLIGLPPGALVGVSFDRTVTTTGVPEPASLATFAATLAIALAARGFRRPFRPGSAWRNARSCCP